MGKKKTFYVGDCYVDSGRIYIGDPAYITDASLYKAQPPSGDAFNDLAAAAAEARPEPLDGAPRALALEPLGKGMGLVFPSGHGDGIYPVYITLDDGGRPEAAYISFKLPPGQA